MARSLKGNGKLVWGGRNGDGLTPVQERFVEEFLDRLHGPESAHAAGSQYPWADADQWGDRSSAVWREVERRYRERARSRQITPERTLEGLANIAYLQADDWQDENGDPLPFGKIPRHAINAMKRYQVKERTYLDGTVETIYWCEPHDQMKAREMLMRYHGLFEMDNRQRANTEALQALLRVVLECIPRELVGQVIRRLQGAARGAIDVDFRRIAEGARA